MRNTKYASINDKNHLVFGGCDTVELAKNYGTPLYVVCEDAIRDRCREVKEAFTGKYPNTQALYASKAFLTMAMCKIIAEEGMGLDVVSSGELYLALQAGFPAENIYFHGNNKTAEEIAFAVEHNIGCMVIDSYHEMKLLQEAAYKAGKRINAILRISPGVSASTHAYISTGQVDSKFGFPIYGGEALHAVAEVLGYPNIAFRGIHCHIGSQIFNVESYREAADTMTNLVLEIRDKLHFEIEILNLGGGFGIYYHEGDQPKPIGDFTEAMMSIVTEKFRENDFRMPKIIIEPGRWMIGEAGITLYTIGTIKVIKGIRTYVSVDGGMADNPRPAMYNAVYEAVLANKAGNVNTSVFSIAGKCCESGDMLVRDVSLPQAESGDTLAVFSTGAYNYSMSSNYNKLRRPAVVMVKQGQPRMIVKRESYEDLIRNEIL